MHLLFSRTCYVSRPSPVHDPKNIWWTTAPTHYETSHSVLIILLLHVSSESCLQSALLKHTHYNHVLALRWEKERERHTHTHIRSHAENFCLCIMHNNTCLNGEGKRYGYLNVIVTTAPKARYWRKERSDERRIRRRKQLLVDLKETRRWWILERGSTRSHSPGELALKDVIGLSYKTTWWLWW